MKEKIEKRIKYLKSLKSEIVNFCLHEKDEMQRHIMAERNMQIGMEISFLEELLAD